MDRGPRSLRDDDRGQSIWIGAVLLFGIAVVGLTIYQATIVPGQNAEVEFNHYQSVQDDMTRLGSETVGVAGRNVTGSTTVGLGLRYPPRSIALNPPPVSGALTKRAEGTLEVTTASGPLDVSGLCGGAAETYGIAYDPAYNEFDGQPIVYENGQVYVDGASTDAVLDGRTVINTDSDEIDIYRLGGPLPTESRTSSLSLDLRGSSVIGKATGVDVTSVTFPSSGLSEDKWESAAINGTDPADATAAGDDIRVDVTDSDSYTVRCYTIGVGGEPAPTDFDPAFRTGGDSPSGSPSANDGDLILTNAVQVDPPQQHQAELSFNNTGRAKTITAIRVPSYEPDGSGGEAVSVESFGAAGTFEGSETLAIPSQLTDVDTDVSFPENTTTTITVGFNPTSGAGNVQTSGDFFLLTVKFASGETKSYFVTVE